MYSQLPDVNSKLTSSRFHFLTSDLLLILYSVSDGLAFVYLNFLQAIYVHLKRTFKTVPWKRYV